MMQLGFVSAIFPDLSLEEVFIAGKAAGYTCVELMCWPVGKADRRYAGVTHIDVGNFDQAAAAKVTALAQRHAMNISALGYYPNLLSPNAQEADAAVAHLRLVIAAARKLGLSVVTTFIGRDWQRSVEDNWPRFLIVWRDLMAYAAAQQVRIAIENCPMLFTADEWPGGKNLASSPAIWRRMFEAIPGPWFGLNYDPSHLLWQQMDYLAPLTEFASRIFHVHLKDAAVDHERLNQVGILDYPLAYHAPKLPGRGDINWQVFLEALAHSGYAGPVCVEVEDRDYEANLADREQALSLTAQYLGPLLALHT